MASRTFSIQVPPIRNQFLIELSVTIDNITMSANSMFSFDTGDAEYSQYKLIKTGYYPLCVSGYTLTNASTGGKNVDNCVLFTIRTSAEGNIYGRIKNNGGTEAKIRLRLYVLWVKDT